MKLLIVTLLALVLTACASTSYRYSNNNSNRGGRGEVVQHYGGAYTGNGYSW